MRHTVLLLVLLWLTALVLPAHAVDKPAKPGAIILIVPFTQGGPTDEIAQALAQALATRLQQKVVVRNVPGAGGILGTEQVAKSRPDGRTLLLSNIGQATSGALHTGLRYDPVKSFEAIGLVAEVPMTLIGSSRLVAADLKELRSAMAGAKPHLTYAHAGAGSASHLCGLMLADALKADLAAVSYPGTAEALADVTAGRVDLLCDQTSNTLVPIGVGRVRVFGVTTKARVVALPNVPTLAEAGLPKFQLAVWHGLYAAKGTPDADITRLSTALQGALQAPEFKQKLADLGAVPAAPQAATPEALRKRLEGDIARLAPLLKRAVPTAK
jgi:tripartite-type tricarboxylate transporter receptor subunit TctC